VIDTIVGAYRRRITKKDGMVVKVYTSVMYLDNPLNIKRRSHGQQTG
jgi:hypothetical protein